LIVNRARGQVEASGHRDQTLPTVDGDGVKRFTRLGMPWHYGWIWPPKGGDSANLLTPAVGDPKYPHSETKSFMVNVAEKKEA